MGRKERESRGSRGGEETGQTKELSSRVIYRGMKITDQGPAPGHLKAPGQETVNGMCKVDCRIQVFNKGKMAGRQLMKGARPSQLKKRKNNHKYENL